MCSGIAKLIFSMEYEYNSLDRSTRCIRLLQIQAPCTGKTLMQCLLATFELDQCPPYYALSYTWGPAEERSEESSPSGTLEPGSIMLDGAKAEVTANLYSALQHLYVHFGGDEKAEGPFLWIDAVCINQQSDEERNHQVGMMDEIYSLASKVIIWLGADPSGTMPPVNEMLTKLERMHMYAWETYEQEGISLSVQIHDRFDRYSKMFDLPHLEDPRWDAFLSLYARRWFTRLWVLQEAALARQVEVLCGHTTLDWNHVASASDILRNGMAEHILQADASRTRAEMMVFYPRLASRTELMIEWCANANVVPAAIQPIHRLFSGPTKTIPTAGSLVPTLLFLTHNFFASDPRDRIYAMLGMVKKITAPQGEIIDVNYGEKVEHLYIRITRYILESTSWLGILSSVRPKQTHHSLPSWAPEFAASATAFIGGADKTTNASGNYLVMPYDKEFMFFFSGKTLKFPAAKIATITAISEPLQEFYDCKGEFERGIQILLDTDAIYPFTCQPRLEVLWRCLVANDLKGVDPSMLQEAFLKWWHLYYLRQADQAITRDIPIENYLRTIPKIEQFAHAEPNKGIPDHSAIIESFLKLANDNQYRNDLLNATKIITLAWGPFLSGRRFLRTKEGHLGLGHQTVQVGDEVWISPRSFTPLVLRRMDSSAPSSHHRLIGECYLHGIMHGEAFKDKEPIWEDVTLE